LWSPPNFELWNNRPLAKRQALFALHINLQTE
jgi:hypothetical protein